MMVEFIYTKPQGSKKKWILNKNIGFLCIIHQGDDKIHGRCGGYDALVTQ